LPGPSPEHPLAGADIVPDPRKKKSDFYDALVQAGIEISIEDNTFRSRSWFKKPPTSRFWTCPSDRCD
jgi:hypothetical protein